MSVENKSSSSGNVVVKVIIGIVLMFGGAWVSQQEWHAKLMEPLEHQGIPLNLGETVSTIGVFLILFPVINIFFVQPLRSAIQDRTTSLESTFSEAEDLRAEMQQMRTEYEARLLATENNAREQIQTQIREAQNLRTQLMSEASARADELVTRAQAEIEAEKQKALTELRLQVVDLTLTAAEKILGENMDSDKNRRLVNEFIDKAEVPV